MDQMKSDTRLHPAKKSHLPLMDWAFEKKNSFRLFSDVF